MSADICSECIVLSIENFHQNVLYDLEMEYTDNS